MSGPLNVSSHAVQRLAERFPSHAGGGVSRAELRHLIAFEVKAAWQADRISARKPPQFRVSLSSGDPVPGMCWAWTEDTDRGYLLAVSDSETTVVTTVRSLLCFETKRLPAAAAAAAA